MIAFDPDAADPAFELVRGDAPLLVSMPHVGTGLPADIAARLTPEAATLADTDWHLPLVYDFVGALGATLVVATQSRYVIDLNRPPDGSSLYPGMTTTSLVPTETFRGEPVWRGAPPGDDEIAARRERWWRPYHATLEVELARLRAAHPRVVLWDAHSIASVLPRFFEGRLPDLNFGTADGASCDPSLIDAVLGPVRAQRDYAWVLNGRYKGGHITRHHGQPARGVHAIQLEMVQAIYMDEAAPFALDAAASARLRPLLRACLGRALDWARAG
ncbi:MAG: N-formylglutamate deformylase [Burkholderiaceae bacterium]|jgi:N-formylglutamate deformylase|nr:N-formylglutamate deformylase [Burkholderiales bacterium]MCZ8096542.1 N-formylglutamate deformylase [Burkholderiales bacterium]MCZ8339754.1 N-formylglutamate deformylase [Burkholderiaceae bacterium]